MGSGPAACLVALGCPKNTVDSEHLLAGLGTSGYTLTDSPEDADLVVVTTCAFIQRAVAESERVIRRILALKASRPGMKVVVAGCLVQRLGARVVGKFPSVDLFAGLDELASIPSLLREPKATYACSAPHRLDDAGSARLVSTPRHYAYLKIADGCDNLCSYCLIPSIRGHLRSRPVPDILKEARALARLGTKELVLVAQDTTAYGSDLYRRPAIVRLLKELSAVEGIEWIRLMYTHPARVTDLLIAEFWEDRKLCRYIDLPLQHVSDRILRTMHRGYGRAEAEDVVTRLREVPGMAIRTTMIVGLPGETEREFEELLEYVRTAKFERLGAYAYSREPGTVAAGLPGQVLEHAKRRRLQQLMQLQARVSGTRLRKLRGRTIRVLMDTPTTGRTQWDAPEVDGNVLLEGDRATPGALIEVEVLWTTTHDLVCRLAAQHQPGPASTPGPDRGALPLP